MTLCIGLLELVNALRIIWVPMLGALFSRLVGPDCVRFRLVGLSAALMICFLFITYIVSDVAAASLLRLLVLRKISLWPLWVVSMLVISGVTWVLVMLTVRVRGWVGPVSGFRKPNAAWTFSLCWGVVVRWSDGRQRDVNRNMTLAWVKMDVRCLVGRLSIMFSVLR